jgi:O-methyltransferase involved in polyketide biosynthesis
VTMYVPEEELRALFRFVAAHPPGSSIVFDYATRTMVDGIKHIDVAAVPPMARASLERFLDLIKDEPWLFGFPVGGEEGFLAELGLTLREVLTIGSEEAAARYLTRADGTTLGAEGHAQAEALRKAAQTAAAADASPEQREQIAERVRAQERHMAYRIAEASVCA